MFSKFIIILFQIIIIVYSKFFIILLLFKRYSNYRPITVSSVFAKLAERIMIPEQDVIEDSQFGLRQGRDTLSAFFFFK